MAIKFNPSFNERQPLTKEAHAKSLRSVSKVRLWKYLLPLSSIGIVIGLACWPYIEEYYLSVDNQSQRRTMPVIKMTNQLINPRMNMIDSKGRPIALKAESAVQTTMERADMINPQSRINMDNGQQLTIKADNGQYNQQDQQLRYDNHVELQNQHGFKIKTSSATIDIKTNQAEGSSPVYGSGPTGNLQSEGFKLSNEGQKVHLIGRSKMSIN